MLDDVDGREPADGVLKEGKDLGFESALLGLPGVPVPDQVEGLDCADMEFSREACI